MSAKEAAKGARNALAFMHEMAKKVGDWQTGRPTRVRLKPGVPPVQTPEHKARRRKRKIAHESRRRNRGR